MPFTAGGLQNSVAFSINDVDTDDTSMSGRGSKFTNAIVRSLPTLGRESPYNRHKEETYVELISMSYEEVFLSCKRSVANATMKYSLFAEGPSRSATIFQDQIRHYE